MPLFTDTHCHIHETDYPNADSAYQRAMSADIKRLICVGTDVASSVAAVTFATTHDSAWASLGVHPHEAKSDTNFMPEFDRLLKSEPNNTRIVAIGEIGLDYFYDNSPRQQQIELLEAQLDLAQKHDLPVIFHVRDSKENSSVSSPKGRQSVWDDFWPIFSSFPGLRGVLHSYTDNLSNLDKAMSEGLLIGVNGISTFARDKTEVYQAIPLENIILETDAPFLTPVPHRGMVNEPAFITLIAQYLANLQSISLEELSRATERNATTLFSKINN